MKDYKHLAAPKNNGMKPFIQLLMWYSAIILFGVLLVYWYSPATVDAWWLS